MDQTSIEEHFRRYATNIATLLTAFDWDRLAPLAHQVERCWAERRQVFLCGNGGSAGNAIHLANDYIYGTAKQTGRGLKVNALPSNSAVVTCLANDVGYQEVFAEQISVLAEHGDLLICLSGSGNSPNIVRAVETAKEIGVVTSAILGYNGGIVKGLVDIPVHFDIGDMQVAEDAQLICGHMIMQWLYLQKEKLLPNKG